MRYVSVTWALSSVQKGRFLCSLFLGIFSVLSVVWCFDSVPVYRYTRTETLSVKDYGR